MTSILVNTSYIFQQYIIYISYYTPPVDVSLLNFVWEYWSELFAINPLCNRFTFPIRIICKGVSGGYLFGAADLPPLYIVVLFYKVILNELVWKVDIVEKEGPFYYVYMIVFCFISQLYFVISDNVHWNKIHINII